MGRWIEREKQGWGIAYSTDWEDEASQMFIAHTSKLSRDENVKQYLFDEFRGLLGTL